jgi:hypothetical protein
MTEQKIKTIVAAMVKANGVMTDASRALGHARNYVNNMRAKNHQLDAAIRAALAPQVAPDGQPVVVMPIPEPKAKRKYQRRAPEVGPVNVEGVIVAMKELMRVRAECGVS